MPAKYNSDWLCIACGHVLGQVLGGELYPNVPAEMLHTSGPNLVVSCPQCKATKTWYTSDAIVRALYQLIGAVSDASAKSMIRAVSKELNERE